MSFLKPVFKTFLLSTLVFITIVFLGMKFQWVDFFKSDEQVFPLEIPRQSANTQQDNQFLIVDQEVEFHPEVVGQNRKNIYSVASMTKAQVIDSCRGLSEKIIVDENQRYIFLGDCVVSNYQDPIQTINSTAQPSQKNAIQQQKHKNECVRTYSQRSDLLPIDRNLLIGICFSN